MASRAFDIKTGPGISGSASGCFVGVQFASGYRGVLKEVSFFLNYFNVNKIVDNLVFQASSDNFASDVVDLQLVGEEAHEGWNYYDLVVNDTMPSYQYYRLFSPTAQGCDNIGELRIIGNEVLNNSDESYSCEVEVVTLFPDPTTGEDV